jgi:predicted transcriptional regulator
MNPEKAVKELTMLVMYLTRFNEKSRFASEMDMAWKGYDFDIMNELEEEDYIRQGSHRSKSVAITDNGIKLSRELLAKYNILDWK